MIKDTDTNLVYISDKLRTKKRDFYNRFTCLLDEMGILWKELEGTNDIWARDYMPIQLDTNEFLMYQYNPDYLQEKKYNGTITDARPICKELGINYKETKLKLDGGNITMCGEYIVLTVKVFKENGKDDYDPEFTDLLKKILGHEIIILPWHCDNSNDEDADVYGHSDGFIHWCGGKKVLMSNHKETDPIEAEKIKKALVDKNFEVTEMLFDVQNPEPLLNWAYVNYLQVGNKIIVPAFGIAEDRQALKYITEANLGCTIRQIRMRDIANNGGALHCITWNIRH